MYVCTVIFLLKSRTRLIDKYFRANNKMGRIKFIKLIANLK